MKIINKIFIWIFIILGFFDVYAAIMCNNACLFAIGVLLIAHSIGDMIIADQDKEIEEIIETKEILLNVIEGYKALTNEYSNLVNEMKGDK